MPRADCEVYAEALLLNKYGFPFWLTEPQSNLPAAYCGQGVQIGDILTSTEDGGYDFFFNIFLPDDHPINCGRTPANFIPLSLQTWRDVTHRPNWKNPGSQISNMEAKQICLEANVALPPGIPVEFGGGFEFKTCSTSGGILVLPEGAARFNYAEPNRLREDIDRNIDDWFNHINGPAFGRNAQHLYIVTGCDKSAESAVASFNASSSSLQGESGQEISLKFTAGSTSFGASYSWHTSSCASRRITPVHFQDDGSKSQNQCIFVRGFTYTRSQRSFRRGIKVKVGDLSKTKPWKMDRGLLSKRSPSSSTSPSLPSSSGSSPPAPMTVDSAEDNRFLQSAPYSPVELVALRSDSHSPMNCLPPDNTLLAPLPDYESSSNDNSDSGSDNDSQSSDSPYPPNPSQLINTFMLENDIDVDYFVTHDDEWCSVQAHTISQLLDPTSLLAAMHSEDQAVVLYTKAPSDPPRICEAWLDVPPQRLYYLLLGLLLLATKAIDLFRYLMLSSNSAFCCKWLLIDTLYCLTPSYLQIPRLRYSKAVVLFQILFLALLNGLLFGGIQLRIFGESGVILLVLTAAAVLYFLYQRYRISVAHIRGPSPESFFLGNLPELFQSEAGVPDFKWQAEYGGIVRIKGAFGEDRLMVSDPKAMQYIFHTSGYGFLKWPERTEISRVLMGRGLLWADGDTHKRQRKVMMPGFGAPESKAFLPIFRKVAAELTVQWTDILASSPGQSAVLNVASWLSRATMDSVGEAAFDYHFGALANQENELMKAYFGLMSDTLGSPSKMTILMQTMLPVWVLGLLSRYSRSRNLVHARKTAELANQITRELVDMKSEALLQGKGNKDILSLLVKANASENEGTRLTDEEMLAQMRTILLAGHETSATSLCWVLLEVARHKDVQNKLREEIRATEQAIISRGDKDFTTADFDNMPYMAAVLKECLRFHPAVYANYRQAARDDVLPLLKPIVASNGEVITKLPIPKGMKIVASIAAYNRNKDVFGEDADVFNPSRWLNSDEKRGPGVGVYANLLTFSGGVRSCVGWRFALYEVQALLVEIVNNFELSPSDDISRLRREACLVMIPTLEGEVADAENLPLRVTIAPRE